MKRLLFFAALIVAIGSIGGNMTAHAQTVSTQMLTAPQIAALQQQLDVAKATLANLEMQAGAVPPADAGMTSVAPASTAVLSSGELSASQINAFQGTLSALSVALSQLIATAANNTTLTTSQKTAVASTLAGMKDTLVAMATSIANLGSASAPVTASVATAKATNTPVAVNTPSSAKTAAVAPTIATAQTPATTPSVPTVGAAVTQPATTNAAPQTAQVSSLWSFTKAHWPTIVIVLLIIAILAILFWPEKETVKTVHTGTSGSGKPQSAPTTNATVSASQTIDHSSTKPATPVANAVAAPAQH